MEKTIFISGTHCVGKTTTIDSLLERSENSIKYMEDSLDHQNPYILDKFKRQIWRLNKYHLDALEISEQSKSMLKRYLLVDRCIFDHEAYTRAFYLLNWIQEKELKKIDKVKKILFDYSILPKNIIFLFPSEEWTKARIKERWNSEKKKWEEDNFRYLHILRDQYRIVYKREQSYRNILRITETDKDKRIDKILQFMNKLK